MQFLIVFLEGVITFISPCLLPMLPVFVFYFAGGGQHSNAKIFKNAVGFVLGFTIVFVLLGAAAGIIGSFLVKYQTILNIVAGAIIVFFGLHFLGFFNLSIFKGMKPSEHKDETNFFQSVLFGMAFSVSWTPCASAFLGSALLLASVQGELLTGVLMLFCYSLGLGIPFMVCAVLIDKLKVVFDTIKKHYEAINKASGIMLIILGVAVATGMLSRLLTLFV